MAKCRCLLSLSHSTVRPPQSPPQSKPPPPSPASKPPPPSPASQPPPPSPHNHHHHPHSPHRTGKADSDLVKCATASADGVTLHVSTTQPGVQLYTVGPCFARYCFVLCVVLCFVFVLCVLHFVFIFCLFLDFAFV